MNKKDFCFYIQKQLGPMCSKSFAEQVVSVVFEQLGRTIRQKRAFTYPGFGTFKVKRRAARKGRNPKTGETIIIPPTTTVTFKPAPFMKAKLP